MLCHSDTSPCRRTADGGPIFNIGVVEVAAHSHPIAHVEVPRCDGGTSGPSIGTPGSKRQAGGQSVASGTRPSSVARSWPRREREGRLASSPLV